MLIEQQTGYYVLKTPVYYKADGTVNSNAEDKPTSLTNSGNWLQKDIHLNRRFVLDDSDSDGNLINYNNYLTDFNKKAIVIPFKIANWSTPETPAGFVTEVKVEKVYKRIEVVKSLPWPSNVLIDKKADDYGGGSKPADGATPLLTDDIVSIKVVSLLNGDTQTKTNASAVIISTKCLFSFSGDDDNDHYSLEFIDGVIYKINLIFKSVTEPNKVIGGLNFDIVYYASSISEYEYNVDDPDPNYDIHYEVNRLSVLNLRPSNVIYKDPFMGNWLTGLKYGSQSLEEYPLTGNYSISDFASPNAEPWEMNDSYVSTSDKKFLKLVFKLHDFENFNNISFKLYNERFIFTEDGEVLRIPFNNTAQWLSEAKLISTESFLNNYTFTIENGILILKFPLSYKYYILDGYFSLVLLQNNIEKFMLYINSEADFNDTGGEDSFFTFDIGTGPSNNLEIFSDIRHFQADHTNQELIDLSSEKVYEPNTKFFLGGLKLQSNSGVSFPFTGTYNPNDFSIDGKDRWIAERVLNADNNEDFVLPFKINNLIGSPEITFRLDVSPGYVGGTFFNNTDTWLRNTQPLTSDGLLFDKISLVKEDSILKIVVDSEIPIDYIFKYKKAYLVILLDGIEQFLLEAEFRVFTVFENGVEKHYKSMKLSLVGEYYYTEPAIILIQNQAEYNGEPQSRFILTSDVDSFGPGSSITFTLNSIGLEDPNMTVDFYIERINENFLIDGVGADRHFLVPLVNGSATVTYTFAPDIVEFYYDNFVLQVIEVYNEYNVYTKSKQIEIIR